MYHFHAFSLILSIYDIIQFIIYVVYIKKDRYLYTLYLYTCFCREVLERPQTNVSGMRNTMFTVLECQLRNHWLSLRIMNILDITRDMKGAMNRLPSQMNAYKSFVYKNKYIHIILVLLFFSLI